MHVLTLLSLVVVTIAGSSRTHASLSVDDPNADSTPSLQELIDQTPDGGDVRLDPGRHYRVDGTLVIEGRRDVTFDGRGATLDARTVADHDRAHLRVVESRGVIIRNVEIVGANPSAGLADRAYQPNLVGQHGIRLEGAEDVEIDNVTVRDTFGDFVYVGRDTAERFSERVWIHDSTFRRSGRQGITVTAGRDVVIERNLITQARRASIDLEPNSPSWGADNIHVLDNLIGPGRLLFVAAAGRGPVDNVVIARNTLRGHLLNVWVEPPAGTRRSSFYVVDNESDTDATRPPLRFTRVDGLVVTDNVQPVVRAGEALIRTDAVCGALVQGNDITPGQRQLEGEPANCGTPPATRLPPPPELRGRSDVSQPPGTSSSTTSAPTTTASNDAALTADEQPDDTSVPGWSIAVGVAVVAGTVVLSGWRAARRSGRRRRPRSPTP